MHEVGARDIEHVIREIEAEDQSSTKTANRASEESRRRRISGYGH